MIVRHGFAAIPLRLSLYYAAFFCVAGVLLPFWPVWLASKGMAATEIGTVLALGIGIKVLSAPLAAHIADRTGERRRLILVLVFASLFAFALFGIADGYWPILAITLVFNALWPPVMSLAESLTLMAATGGRFAYGRVRLWGSFSFIVVAVACGQILVDAPATAIFWTSLLGVAMTAATCLGLPDVRTGPSQSRRLPLFDTLANRQFALGLAACALIQGSHAVYYAFGTLHWQAIGHSELVIGILWAEGVVAEIVLFATGGALLRRCGAARLVVLAGVTAAVRWLGIAFFDGLPALLLLQTLHAFSFGAAHLGAMHMIARDTPAALSATAQSLYSGLVWGFCLGLMLFAAGWLYAAYAGGAFVAMSVAGAAGAAAALPLVRRERRTA
jgi:PPP family 3-phenylpropionic acid transporter